MSQRHSNTSVADQALLLERQLSSDLRIGTSSVAPHGKCGSVAALDNAAFLEEHSPPPLGPRRIVLSTESPAALKVGTQQLIPRCLAEGPKAKVPSRHQSFSEPVVSKEAARWDPKRMSAPSISFEDLEEMDGGGTLKRNLRSMSYRAAMKSLGGSEESETSKMAATLKPPSGQGSAYGARSPGRNKVGARHIARTALADLQGEGGGGGVVRSHLSCLQKVLGSIPGISR